MLKNYFKITIRNLLKDKVSTFINLFGLGLGLSACLLVFLVVNYELNYDNFHENKDRIYRVVQLEKNPAGDKVSASTPFPLRAALINDYPELEKVTQVFYPERYQLQWKEEQWTEDKVIFADSTFFKVFDFEVISGNPVESFKKPNTAFVTESMAKARFGDQSPIGEIVRLSGHVDLEIAGILKDPPNNSHLPFSMIITPDSFSFGPFKYDSWAVTIGFACYVTLPKEMKETEFEKLLSRLSAKYLKGDRVENTIYSLQPLREIHFDKSYANFNPGYTIDTSYLFILGFIGLFILLLACINFVNLSTAVAIKKSKEVGVRKVLGASRAQLVYQFLGEAFLLTLLAMLVAMGVAERVVPLINQFLGIGLTFEALRTPLALGFLGFVLLMVSMMSGLYPALVLSGYKPVAALKNKIYTSESSATFLRQGLVTFQFVISQVLIIGTIVIAQQMKYLRNKPLGFDKDHIVTSKLSDQDPLKLQSLKNKLLAHSNVQHVSFAIGVPTSENDMNSDIKVEGVEESLVAGIKTVDFDYKETFDLELVAGRWFLKADQQEGSIEFLVNETTVRQLGFVSGEEMLGKELTYKMGGLKGPVVGIVKDFHTKSLHESIRPQVLLQLPLYYFEAGIKISDNNVPETLAHIRSSWKQVFPEYLFEYSFMDEYLQKNYSRENQLFTIFRICTCISIGIGCLGLFGLISFLVVQKTKEVGVRKVLGATIPNIVMLLSNNFMKLVIIGFLVAAPVVWYSMNQWLSSFAYRIDIEPYHFVLGGILNVAIAFLTIGYRALKAASANPVDSLKDE